MTVLKGMMYVVDICKRNQRKGRRNDENSERVVGDSERACFDGAAAMGMLLPDAVGPATSRH